MPELPEVETVRRTLAARLIDRDIVRAIVRRTDMVCGDVRLLRRGGRIVDVQRHGKQLALLYDDGRCVCVHLGMTGSLTCSRATARPRPHDHVLWRLDDGQSIRFHDPRRFGGLWVYRDRRELDAQRWSRLGPDALTMTAKQLHVALRARRQPIKAALLDQSVIAGLGNIYADEALFACGIWPAALAGDLSTRQVRELVRHVRAVLRGAIWAGGSSLRDYVDGDGRRGGFQRRHKVYGRSGQPCVACGASLDSWRIAGRTTVACAHCQPH